MPLILPNAPQFSRYESNLTATPGVTEAGTAVSHYVTTAHTKNPTYTELIAATAFDAQLIVIGVNSNSVANGNSSTLLDIAIGAASAETVIIPDLLAGFLNSTTSITRSYIIPLYIPAGSRLSARTQSVRVTGSVNVVVQLFGGPRTPDEWWYGSTVEAIGEDAATSAGTKFTPGATGAEGTGVSLGTLSQDAKCLVLGIQGHPDDVSWSARGYHFDVGIDSASTEWLEADRFFGVASASETIGHDVPWWPIFRPFPSGTEIMVRGECSGTADPLSAAVYAIS